MFKLTSSEYNNLILQNAISSWGGTRRILYVFTELQGTRPALEGNMKMTNWIRQSIICCAIVNYQKGR